MFIILVFPWIHDKKSIRKHSFQLTEQNFTFYLQVEEHLTGDAFQDIQETEC